MYIGWAACNIDYKVIFSLFAFDFRKNLSLCVDVWKSTV